MNREPRLVRALVDLADTLDSRFDPLDLFDRLSGHCIALLAVDAAGVVMADARGALRVMASSEDALGRLDLFQVERYRGPSVDCYRSGEPVAADDLRDGGRWPEYADRALAAGYVAVNVLPLRLDGRAIGAVSLLRRSEAPLPGEDLAVAQGLCDIAALALAHWPTEPKREHDLLTSLQAAVSSKAMVELAKGLISQYACVSFAKALELLHEYAGKKRRSLTSVCRDLAESKLSATELLEESRLL